MATWTTGCLLAGHVLALWWAVRRYAVGLPGAPLAEAEWSPPGGVGGLVAATAVLAVVGVLLVRRDGRSEEARRSGPAADAVPVRQEEHDGTRPPPGR